MGTTALLLICLACLAQANATDTFPVETIDTESEAVPVEDPIPPPPAATIEGVADPRHELQTSRMISKFTRVFGSSPVDEMEEIPAVESTEAPPEDDFAIRPFSKPFELINLLLEPVRQANLLLPEQLDPFAERGDGGPTNPNEERRKEELRKEKLRQQQKLLQSRPDARFDEKWHVQLQAGGSFRQGNNPSTNVNAQFRGERHTIHSDFVSRFGAFYSQQQGSTANRRIFGETNYDRNLRGRWISYVRQDAEWDTARLINIRAVSSVGIGFRFVDRVQERLIARLGPTMSYVDYDETAQNGDETRSGWLIEGDYRRLIGEASRFELTSTAFPDFDSEQQFRIRTEGALLFPIGRASVWSWKVGVRHEYIMNPVMGTNPNDVEGYFSIVYTR